VLNRLLIKLGGGKIPIDGAQVIEAMVLQTVTAMLAHGFAHGYVLVHF
jgi:hypothetical protein